MNKRDIDFANAQAMALDAHDETKKHSVVTTDQKCPDCKRSMLIGEVLEVNEGGHRYEIDVKCKAACSPGQVFRI
jgi:hypothetical protein